MLDGGDLRWSFSDLRIAGAAADHFAWRHEAAEEGGRWQLQQLFRVWRRRDVPA